MWQACVAASPPTPFLLPTTRIRSSLSLAGNGWPAGAIPRWRTPAQFNLGEAFREGAHDATSDHPRPRR